MSLKKYAVIKLNTITNTCNILNVFLTKKDALEFMNCAIDDDLEFISDWYKKEHESTDNIAIYQLHFVARKSLVCKYFLQQYEDTPFFDNYEN